MPRAPRTSTAGMKSSWAAGPSNDVGESRLGVYGQRVAHADDEMGLSRAAPNPRRRRAVGPGARGSIASARLNAASSSWAALFRVYYKVRGAAS